MISLAKLIYVILDIFTWVIIGSAIMSWLVAFGVVNVRNQLIRTLVDVLYRVTAPAEDGRANAAIVDLLAGAWRMPKSAFEVTRGATGRDKVVSVSGDPAVLAARIAEWTTESGGKRT